jgi:hypothetical protein
MEETIIKTILCTAGIVASYKIGSLSGKWLAKIRNKREK